MSIYSGPNPNLRNRPNGVPNLAVPEGSPSLFIDFVNNNYATVNNGIKTARSNAMSLITFTRSTSAMYMGPNGFLQTAAINQPRFDYSNYVNFNGTCSGILIEEPRTNLITYSNPNIWASGGVTATTNAGLAPDGTNTAVLLTVKATNSANSHYNAGFNVTSTNTYTASIYAKANTISGWFAFILYSGTGNGARAWFNVATGIIGTVQNDGLGTGANASIQALPNGWYRCSLTTTSNGSSGTLMWEIDESNANQIYQNGGTAGQSIYFWGAQFELGAFPTSLIPTAGATAFRTADSAVLTNTNFSSWYTQSQGTFLLSFARTPATNGNYSRLLPINGGGSIDFMELDALTPTVVGIYGQGITFFGPGFSNINTLNGSTVNAATSYTSNIMKISANGAAPQSTPYGVTAVATSISLGSPTGNFYNGYIKQLTFFPTFLSNTSLQQITS